MTSFRFLHAADLHLDSPLRGLGADAPATRIRQATRDALGRMVDFAIAEKVDFVVVAGDLYDGDWPDFRTGQALVAAFGRLTRAGIRIVAIRGNHDAESVLTRSLRLPDGAALLRADRPDTIDWPEFGVVLHGQSFETRDVQQNLAQGYPAPMANRFNIGLLHTAATGRPGHASYAPCTVEQLAAHGYDYWALGHIHAREEVLRDPWIVFPGNLQGRHANEGGAKGASLVTVRHGRVVAVEHHSLDVVRWQRVTVDCEGAADEEAVLERCRRAIGQAVDGAEGRFLVLRLRLEGPCPAHLALARDPAALRQKLLAAGLEVAEADAFWLEDVRLATRPMLDLDTLRAREDAVGRLVRAIEALAEEPEAATAPAASAQSYAAAMLDRGAGGLRQALGPDHPAVLAAEGHLPPELLQRARDLLLARLAQG
ncbi:metallophosphoesterase family protein [Roseomonas xinghualingensis]|uniref:metallophosphoesterase family protein n=1 Tax=Roseomonas xinghualingensis TaxID=2986475 RepID=UPI0021F1E0C4|nr:DNA repair exonuclease [Roseomonas sp. SXEYE001]MCV4209710.1 DNA repair exonuclease [Roseomonas sp. SXEYE001]